MALHDPERIETDTSITPSDKAISNNDVRAESIGPSSSSTGDHANNSSTNQLHIPGFLDKLKHHVPPVLQRSSSTVWSWLKGPDPPKIWKIRPFLPRLQHLPLRLVDKICPRQWQRILSLLIFYICWIATFAAVLQKSSVINDVNGYGEPLLISCGAVFWYAPPPPSLAPSCFFWSLRKENKANISHQV